jgi:two-component system, NarL family, response regulator LiaR
MCRKPQSLSFTAEHPAMPISVLIADDHGMVRQGLRMYLALDPEITVIGEASNGSEASS